MKVITESIKKGVSFAYISLLKDFSDMLTHPLYDHVESIDTEVYTIIQHLNSIFLSLDTIVDDNENLRADFVNKIQEYQSTLVDRYSTLNGYERELSHISMCLEENYQLATNNVADVQGINYNQFINEFLDFIGDIKNIKSQKYKLTQTIRFIPMRMTKASFLNYIGTSLKRISVGNTFEHHNRFLSVFRQIFDGRQALGYNKYFFDLADAIEKFRTILDKELIVDEILETFEDIHLIKNTVDELFDLLDILHSINSRLCILFALDSLYFTDIMENHISFKDFFFTIKSLIKTEDSNVDYEVILDTLPDRLDEVYSEIKTEYDDITQKLFDKVKNNLISETDESIEKLKIDGLIRSYLLLNIQDAFSFDETQEQSKRLPDSYIEDAKQFLEEQFQLLKPYERKLRMQYLISVMPFIMNNNQLSSYIHHGIDGTSNEVKKAYVLSKITEVMEFYGYFENQHSLEHHHHHDCDCHH